MTPFCLIPWAACVRGVYSPLSLVCLPSVITRATFNEIYNIEIVWYRRKPAYFATLIYQSFGAVANSNRHKKDTDSNSNCVISINNSDSNSCYYYSDSDRDKNKFSVGRGLVASLTVLVNLFKSKRSPLP